jgi:DNA replication regulator SLD2
MEAEEREQLLEQSSLLRQELKTWERDFAAANGGRKAGREDIKQHPTIGMEIEWPGETC